MEMARRPLAAAATVSVPSSDHLLSRRRNVVLAHPHSRASAEVLILALPFCSANHCRASALERTAAPVVVAFLAKACPGVSLLDTDAGRDISPEVEGFSGGTGVDPVVGSFV